MAGTFKFKSLETTDSFTLRSLSDRTKAVTFTLSNISSGQTRVFTFPDASGTIALTTDAPSAHAASHAAGTKAYTVATTNNFGGLSTNVFFRAINAGTAGNNIILSFDGVLDIDSVVGNWNAANPSNQVEAIGDVSQVIDDENLIQLQSGTNAGSDSFRNINQDLGTQDDVTFNTFNTQTFSDGAFVQIGNYYAPANQTEGNNTFFRIGTEDNDNKAAQIGYRAGGETFGREGFICLDFYGADYLFQLSHDSGIPELWTGSSPEKLITFGSEIGVERPIGFTGTDAATNAATTRTNLGAAASGAITTSGLTQATARLIGRTSSGTGAVEEISVGSGLSLSAGELSATGSGVTAVGASTADVLSVSGSDLVADDPNADRIVFWDDSEGKWRYLEAGSGLSISGTTLTATASGGSKTYAVFTAEHNQPPSTAFATLDTRNSVACLDFDDATDESAIFVGIIPEGASLGSGLKIRLHWAATTATSGDVRWDVSLERMTTDLDSDSFDTVASATATTNGTSGILTVTEITLTTIDSVTAGDGFRLKVNRDANNGSNLDSMSGDAELVLVEVRSAA